MKLAEALAERSDCQIRIEEIKKRLIRSSRVQEGEQAAEDTTELLAEGERVHDSLQCGSPHAHYRLLWQSAQAAVRSTSRSDSNKAHASRGSAGVLLSRRVLTTASSS